MFDQFIKNEGLLYFTEYGNFKSLFDSEIIRSFHYGLLINSDNSLYTRVDKKSVSILSPSNIESDEEIFDFNTNLDTVLKQIVFWNAFNENQLIISHLILFSFQIESNKNWVLGCLELTFDHTKHLINIEISAYHPEFKERLRYLIL